MTSRQNNHLRVAFIAALLVAGSGVSCLAGQTAVPPAKGLPPGIPLGLGACAMVPILGTFSLDWNPVFDYESAVAGVDRFSLILTKVGVDEITPLRPGGPGLYAVRSVSVTPLTNGYYHMEFHVPKLQPGNYRVVNAAVAPRLIPNYQGVMPQMTFSPARDRYCITVTLPTTSSSRAIPGS